MPAALCAKPRLAVIPWEPKLNTALGNSSAEALCSQCSCYSSCCCLCSALKLLAVGGRFSVPLPSMQTEILFLWTGHSLCLNGPDFRLLFKALLCVASPPPEWLHPRLGPWNPTGPKSSTVPSADLTALTASTGTCHCTGAKVLFHLSPYRLSQQEHPHS